MPRHPFQSVPVPAHQAAALAERGLRFGLVDLDDEAQCAAWLRADLRGFYGDDPDDGEIADRFTPFRDSRLAAVWDDSAADPATPVATVSSWPTRLTTPGERDVEAWAISSVTVAPTHRRRGIARGLLEAELAAARAHGAPFAVLTVSEATIYGRFGFSPAAFTASLAIEQRRATWTGPVPDGRVHLVERTALRQQAPDIERRARRGVPGEIDRWPRLWDRMFALTADSKKDAGSLRAVRFDDADGEPQGFALYRVAEQGSDFTKHRVTVTELIAATPDAYAALWRYLLDLDLVSEITVDLRSVDEPLRWQVADARAVRTTDVTDHLWARILDVPAAFAARGYAAEGSLVLDVDDPDGIAGGRYLLTTDADGAGECVPLDGDAPAGAAHLALDARALGSLYLGGVSASTFAAAGRITEQSPGAAVAADAVLRSPIAPRLSIWF
ncbi:putative acetyltransferase [Microcella alkaliphila]|uniref:Putative acetyltransferase n=1 Tax=Microcella alkaliphila TaxID=279828 RepID=A0A4Q7TA81_9MICO|nr:GNAT family N-acetyltransferase [Microcella alkaliphila]RZT55938.1 putative acetyltransferase [Microcella alkaliphila]